MGKRQQEELRRLEEALLASDDRQELPDWGSRASQKDSYAVYNTDESDVDLDAYSEDVYRGRSRNGVNFLLTMLGMVALSACILILFKLLGVL